MYVNIPFPVCANNHLHCPLPSFIYLIRAGATGVPPRLAHGAAADKPGLRPRHGRDALARRGVAQEAGLPPLVDTAGAVPGQPVGGRAGALEAALGVPAGPGGAQLAALGALVNVHAEHGDVIEPVAGPAGAHEVAECIAAAAVLAEVGEGAALVDVLQDDGVLVGLEAAAAGADELVLLAVRGWAGLAGGAPGLARGAAAGRPAHLGEAAAHLLHTALSFGRVSLHRRYVALNPKMCTSNLFLIPE